jgi:hypothetical protein
MVTMKKPNLINYSQIRRPLTVGINRKLKILTQVIIFVTASVNEDERGGQDHTSASLLHQPAT